MSFIFSPSGSPVQFRLMINPVGTHLKRVCVALVKLNNFTVGVFDSFHTVHRADNVITTSNELIIFPGLHVIVVHVAATCWSAERNVFRAGLQVVITDRTISLPSFRFFWSLRCKSRNFIHSRSSWIVKISRLGPMCNRAIFLSYLHMLEQTHEHNIEFILLTWSLSYPSCWLVLELGILVWEDVEGILTACGVWEGS